MISCYVDENQPVGSIFAGRTSLALADCLELIRSGEGETRPYSETMCSGANLSWEGSRYANSPAVHRGSAPGVLGRGLMALNHLGL